MRVKHGVTKDRETNTKLRAHYLLCDYIFQ